MKRLHILSFILIILCTVTAVGRSRKSSSGKNATRTEKTVKSDKKAKQAEIKQTEAELRQKREEATRQLNQLNLLSGQIEECTSEIARLKNTVDSVNVLITDVNDSIAVLEARLSGLKHSYGSAMRRSRARRNQISDLAMIFSSSSIREAYRRNRLLQQQARWQSRKVAELKGAKADLDVKNQRLTALRNDNAASLKKLSVKQTDLQSKQTETNTLIATLQSEQSALSQTLEQQRQEARALDNELSRLIAAEQARQEKLRREREEAERRAAAEAEAKRQAAAEAKRKAEAEEAERRAAAEAEKAEKAAAEKAEKQAAEEARKEEEARKKEQKKAEKEQKKAEKEKRKSAKRKKGKKGEASSAQAETAPTPEPTPTPEEPKKSVRPAADLTAEFAGRQGALRWPVDGRRVIVKRFGPRPHPTLPHVTTDNPGIDIETASGASVRCVADGEVAVVCAPSGYNNVIVVRHGDYFTVYANLGNINVRPGDVVSEGQVLGAVHTDAADNNRSVLHFEVRHKQAKQDPEGWLR